MKVDADFSPRPRQNGVGRDGVALSLFVVFENAHHADRIVQALEAAVDFHIAESFLQGVHRQVGAETNLIEKVDQGFVS